MLECSDKLFALSLSVLIFVQAIIARRYIGTWIFPACLFSMAWFIFTFFPLIALFDAPVNPLSILYILFCASAFSLSALPFNWKRAFKDNKKKNFENDAKFHSKFMRISFYVASILAIVVTIISATSNGFSIYSMIFNLLEVSGKYALLRGQGLLNYGIWGKLSVILTYITPVLGGFIYHGIKRRWRKFVVMLVAFVPSLFVMLTQSTKLTLFLAIGFFCAAVLVRKIYSGQFKLMGNVFFGRTIKYIFILLPLLVISFLSRGYSDSNSANEDLHRVVKAFCSYIFGHIYAFSDWFSHYLGEKSGSSYVDHFHAYGNYTFQSIYNIFGNGLTFPPNIYSENFFYKNLIVTNLYTVFRGLIYDFSGIGAIFFIFVAGLVIHFFFYLLLDSRNSRAACVVLIISFVCLQASFIISLLMARYMYLLGLILYVLLWVNDYFWVKRKTLS